MAMKKAYISIMKWVTPVIVIALAVMQLSGCNLSSRTSLVILIVTAIFYTVALILEKTDKII